MLQTRLTELLNVRYPIMLAGMAGVSLAEVVAAVSEAGGYGVLGAGNMSPDQISEEMARVRKPDEQTVRRRSIARAQRQPDRGSAADHRRRCDQLCCRARRPQPRDRPVPRGGTESDHGHRHGETRADGGRGRLRPDRRPRLGSRRTHRLGRLVRPVPTSRRCCLDSRRRRRWHLRRPRSGGGARRSVVQACGSARGSSPRGKPGQPKSTSRPSCGPSESDTVVSRCWTGKTLRALRNATTEDWERRPQEIKPFPQQAELMAQRGLLGFLFPEMAERDPAHNCFPAGQGCGGIAAVQTCREIVDEFVADATAVLSKLAS